MGHQTAATEPHHGSALFMDTLVALQIVTDAPKGEVSASMERAFGWFAEIERICSRFETESEVMHLTRQIGTPVPVSDTLFTLIEFALEVSRLSGGAFDPTVGALLEQRGFNRNYRTGERVATAIAPTHRPSYRDVELDPARRTVTLHAPLILDLGAVAKGLAIDLAARELAVFGNYTVDAGGDLYVKGWNAAGEPWSVGIRHPRRDGELIARLRLSDAAVCTSGDYERAHTTGAGGHHLLDPGTGHAFTAVASVTVVAPTAMVADALSTAAFILGPTEGRAFLERQGVEGLIISPALEQCATSDFARYLQ